MLLEENRKDSLEFPPHTPTDHHKPAPGHMMFVKGLLEEFRAGRSGHGHDPLTVVDAESAEGFNGRSRVRGRT